MASHDCNPVCKAHGCWAECYICGFEYPIDAMQLHYKKERYVCCECADCPSFSDYLEDLIVPEEERCDTGGQSVSGQGGQPGLPTIVPPPTPPPPGGGGGGTECNEGWDYIGRGIYYGFPLQVSNINWNIQSGLRGFGFTSISGGGVLIDVDEVASLITQPITITRFMLRCNETSGVTPCKCRLELIKNGTPTGMLTGFVTMAGDTAFTMDGQEVAFAPGDTYNWKAHLYDLLDNYLTCDVGQSPGSLAQASKWVCGVVEYTAENGFFVQPDMQHVQTNLAVDIDPYYRIPTSEVQFQNRPLTGAGFNANFTLHDWIIRARYTRNFVQSRHQFQLVDVATNLTSNFNLTGPGICEEPHPLTWTYTGPFTEVVDQAIQPITATNIDTVGRFQFLDDIGAVQSVLFGGADYYYEGSWSYKFPDHPHSQYILASFMSLNSNAFGTRRAPLCGVSRSSLNASRVGTPLMTKGRFHHFAFWSHYVNVIGRMRAQLLVDFNVLFELIIPAGERLRSEERRVGKECRS